VTALKYANSGAASTGWPGGGYIYQGAQPAPTGGAQNQFNALRFTVDLQGVQATGTKALLECDFLDIQNVDWWLKKHPNYTPYDPSNAGDVAENDILSFTLNPGSVSRRASNAGSADKGFTNELRSGQIVDWMNFGAQGIVVEAIATVTHRNGNVDQNVKLSFQCTSTNATSGTYQHQTISQFGEPIPVGLAEQIYDAVSVLMYEGEVTLQERDCSGSVSIGSLFNLTNGANMAWATMAAQVQKVVENLDTGDTSLEFGPPKHLSAGDLVDLLRVNRRRIVLFSPNLQQTGQSGGNGSVDLGSNTPEKNSAHAQGTANPLVISAAIDGSTGAVTHAVGADVSSTWTAPNNPGSVTISLQAANGQQIAIRPVPVCINGVTGMMYFLCSPIPN